MELEQIEGSKNSSQNTTFNNEDGKTSMDHKGGGWATLPFIVGTMAGLSLAASGWSLNLIVFLINEFNVKNITAILINNVVLGCNTLFPIAGAILADTFFDSYTLVTTFSFVSLLGTIMFTLTTIIPSLKPLPCVMGSFQCPTPSKLQYAVLYIALVLSSLGAGGTRFIISTMGADQFDKPNDQRIFFIWFFLALYIPQSISLTAIIYIQDNVSWGVAFGICVVANAIALLLFLSGKSFYRRNKPNGNPFVSLFCVAFAAIQKRNASGTFGNQDYNYGSVETTNTLKDGPSKNYRFLNCAALKTESDDSDQLSRSINAKKSWKLCTVEQVEDLKSILKIMPLWSSNILLSTTIGMVNSLTVLQVLTMDRSLGPHFEIPAGSFIVFNILAMALSVLIIDFLWKKFFPHSATLTPLLRIKIGHIINIVTMLVSALIERRRLNVARTHRQLADEQPNSVVLPISALWIVVPLAVLGISEGFHFPGQIVFYYEGFPKSLRNTSTAMLALLVGIGYYLSTAITGLVRRTTGWLPDNINDGRLDNVFWMLAVIGGVNLGYHLLCANFFKKYQNIENPNDPDHANLPPPH